MGPPKPQGWTPASSAEEAIERMRVRWSQPQLDHARVVEHVMERVAIMYEHRPPAPTYRVLPCDPTGYRIFRRELDGWRGDRMEGVGNEKRPGVGPIIGVLWMLSFSTTFFTGIAFVGASFPEIARLLFILSLAAFASATTIGVGLALVATTEEKSTRE